MMNQKIAVVPIYGDAYLGDRLFDPSACKIGQNLLLPNIIFKQKMETIGYSVHTIDMYRKGEADIVLFFDIPNDSIRTISSPIQLLKYLLKKKWKRDYFYQAIKFYPREKLFLQINEPPTVNSMSYDVRYHNFFKRILTWNDSLVDGEKYYKFFIPQYKPENIVCLSAKDKKFLTMIVANKSSKFAQELYSARRDVIEFFETKKEGLFDLYGIGWEKCGYKNYKGRTEKKLTTLSQYKFSICFENVKDIPGYITEKIFDCFFAGTVPIYLGAENIKDYIPENTFIDARQFQSKDEMLDYLLHISEEQYELIQNNIVDYLNSDQFENTFSVSNNVAILKEFLLGKSYV